MVGHAPPSVDLIGVVGRAAVATLATGDARQAVVPVTTISDEAIRGNRAAAGIEAGHAAARADSFEVAAPGEAGHIEQHAQRFAHGQRVLQTQLVQPTPLPLADTSPEPAR